jgi:hypothetical protein
MATSARSTALTCGACEKRYDAESWPRLDLVERLEPHEVRRFATIWPEGLCVEVRRCARCSQSIAAKRPAPLR